jgi:hypothetical protein
MISWETILYGAALSAVAAGALVAIARRELRPGVFLLAALSAGAGALAWNAVLHRVHAREFFVDAPVGLLPASWQDAGSGVFTTAAATVFLGLGALRRESGRRASIAALLCGVASFLVDVYLY